MQMIKFAKKSELMSARRRWRKELLQKYSNYVPCALGKWTGRCEAHNPKVSCCFCNYKPEKTSE